MAQVPLINGTYTDSSGEFRTFYPRNYVPVPKQQGISNGYHRPADGIVLFATGPGIDRGCKNWDGTMYRVMGTKLVRVSSGGVVTTLGDVGGTGQVTMDYSFDYLAIASGGNLYYFDGTTLTQVTDPDLGTVLDVLWVDGFFATTDGENIIVTDLNDPFSINPLKYGSSEVDPDPIKRLLKLHNEVHALNRYTIEAFDNIGGDGFPLQRIDGAMVQRGCIGKHACALFAGTIAFLGSGRDEAPSVYLMTPGSSAPIATREINIVLQEYTEAELAAVVMEARVDKSHNHLYIHLPDQTLVYDHAASQATNELVWFTLDSGIGEKSAYRARNMMWCYDKWLAGDPTSSNIGQLVNTVSSHYGNVVGCEFITQILYSDGNGAILHEMELVGLPGRCALGANPVVWSSYSTDGQTWSMERSISAGRQGERNKRLIWLQNGSIENWRIQRFRSTSDAHLSVARLEVNFEPLFTRLGNG